ncbi:MAG: Rpn family recombination-promoting nuclease/putative transposase [Roseburia sp.]|nr:Rpn family recombination-promoting nuclease/putative transposase [Roseburia sp.]MCM1277821.1 Rpn family recombination-promoting nuclease/putative transposase [Robinsoniella sp.]
MEKDLLQKRYLSDNERYADLINGFLFAGKQVVSAKQLSELDTQTGFWRIPGFSVKYRKGRQKYRDLIRKAAFGVNFAVFGIENQTEVDYLMPLRVMSYDIGEYEHQAEKQRKIVRKQKGISKAEFLSGFTKKDRLKPCITLVLFYGENWDGSKRLHDILDFRDMPEELQTMVNDYRIFLFEIRKLTDMEVFRTDLKQVFSFMRYSNDKQKLRELVEQDQAYMEMEEDAYEAAAVFTGAKELMDVKRFHEKGGKVDMCQALNALIADGRAEGQMEELLRITRTMAEKGLEALDIAKFLDRPEEDTERMIELVKSNPQKSNRELAKEMMKQQM